MKTCRLFIDAVLILVVINACAATGSDQNNPRIVDHYLEKALRLEQNGDLPGALEQYKMALTVDAGHTAAQENCARLSGILARMADEHYRLGMKYHLQGKYGLARKEFLKALKCSPDHTEAYQMLASRRPETVPPYIFHMVEPGESLSMIAKHYYGDFRKFEVIAKFNKLSDATMVQPGQRLMIPKIEGVEFVTGSSSVPEDETTYVVHRLRPGETISKLAQRFYGDYNQFHIIAQFNGLEDATHVTVGRKVKIPKVAGLPFHADAGRDDSSPADPDAPPGHDQIPKPSDNEQILAYREAGIALLREGNYEDAILELNKVAETFPKDPDTCKYLAAAYFGSGKQLFDQQDFHAAREAFEISRQYNPDCDQCLSYIESSKIGPLLSTRSKGLDHFNKGEFQTAVTEFEQFLKVKPQDDEIRAYLAKAYFQQALNNYNKGDFLEAKRGFESALEYDSACNQCERYIEKSVVSFKETHYNKGIVYYGKEQLTEAIAEWEMVYRVDPGFKDVDRNLNKARTFKEKLEKIKKAAISGS